MTVVNVDDIEIKIKINEPKYSHNIIKEAIENNDPIEDKLHVIAVVSNPCMFSKRYILMKEFIQRIEKSEPNVILYIVEMAYKNQKHMMTNKNNKRHLQLTCECPIWHKENMINIGVKCLLPKNYKAFAWIDADIEFENSSWALDTLKILNGSRDIVQLFSHCVDMDEHEMTMKVFNSAGYQQCKGKTYCGKGENYWHPGYAWAITRKAYEKIGGLYELAILGSGDNIMLFCLLERGLKAIQEASSDNYKKTVTEYQHKMKTLRLGYVPGIVRHHFHGSKINRKYQERWKILVKHGYSPDTFIAYDETGILVPTLRFPEELKKEILEYFFSRNEDESLADL